MLVHDALMQADGLTGDGRRCRREGSVLPDSYAFQRGDTRAAVVARMQKAMRDYLAAAWAKRKPGIAVTTPERGDHPRLDRREGDRQAVRAADGRGGLCATGCSAACRCRPIRP